MRAIDHWLESRRNRAAFKQLSGLGERLLADMGIGEAELNNLRRGRNYRGR
jgi:uncharacterized protein YjiS (DUF1127 family)